MCSKHDNHYRLKTIKIIWWSGGGRDLYDSHLMSTRIFPLIMNKIFAWEPKAMRKMAMDNIWN